MPTALLVSHGQPSDPEIGEREIASLAIRVAAQTRGIDVIGVTLAMPGRLEVVSANAPPDTVVLPMFMADGWFTQVQLPKRLGGVPLKILPPYGCHPKLAGFAAGWLGDVVARSGWNAETTNLIVVGHGSGRSKRPADVTHAFAAHVQNIAQMRSLRVGFVEEDPCLKEVLAGLDYRAICLPFFAARRGHVLEDLPEAIAEAHFTGMVLPPIGLHPCTPGFIALMLDDATATQTRAAS
ncbi:MAG: cobalamin biosynthesis protein CbiX [Marinovum sp.]|nr:cobalamin biosynthesis protein CbiX [Marinovum sp.]